MNETLSNVLTGTLVVCAVIVTGLAVDRSLGADRQQDRSTPRTVENPAAIAAAGRLLGPRHAPVKIIEFADFQCPFCARAHDVLEAVRREHPGRFTVVFRHLPLRSHRHAFRAAIAAECAADQGRFRAYHDILFDQQDSLGILAWTELARRIEISDIVRFRDCLEDERPRRRVERDARVAQRLGLRGTPTLIIDGSVWVGAPSPERVLDWIE